MDERIREALAEEIMRQFEGLKSLAPASEEEQTVVENITKLYKLGLEDVKADTDYDEKVNRREMDEKHEKNELDRQTREEQIRKDQLSEQIRDRYFRTGLEAAGIILPLLFYACWIDRGFTLETDGTYTSKTLMNLLNKFRPGKK